MFLTALEDIRFRAPSKE